MYKESKSIDLLVSDLCQQIDDIKEERDYWHNMFIEERGSKIRMENERFEQTKKDVGNALLFALSVKEGADGSLVIPKSERKALADAMNGRLCENQK